MTRKIFIGIFSIFIILIAGFFGANYYVNKKISQKLNVKIEELKPYADISYRSLDYSLLTGKLNIYGIKILYTNSSYPITISQLIISDFDREHDIPLYADVRLKGISFYLNSLPEDDRLILKALGYGDKLTAYFSTVYAYYPDKKQLLIKDLSYRIKGIGAVKLRLHLANIKPIKEKELLYFLLSGWLNIKIVSGEIDYSDEGLFERAVNLIAREKHLSTDQLKAKIIRKIRDGLGNSKDTVSQMAAEALIRFVLKPGTIKITVNPSRPTSFGEVLSKQSLEDALKCLNIKIEAN
ncbi:hypothetical protein [Desulfurobacterium indicum]|uniref:Uncharacterized protein n=1 Tax=Desulfurobacterium indicum TaxID=1914305 RepID=A0A1R1MKN9_9BACT|nr:hypothetical protein [Desulfurobacterium indicum]OMH40372.1 hypothetical protein BLW93_05445 [Desulfurobacterium indicum]